MEKEKLTAEERERALTSVEGAERWEEDVDWYCIMDVHHGHRKCAIWDEQGTWLLQNGEEKNSWWKCDKPSWVDEIEAGEGEGWKETWPSYREEDGDRDKAFMWDELHKRWFVRFFNCAGGVFWQEPSTCDCTPAWLWDMSGESIDECYLHWDDGVYCGHNCPLEWIGDGYCDYECLTDGCRHDEGDCNGWCDYHCNPHWLGDGRCDNACNIENCQYDLGDCGPAPGEEEEVIEQEEETTSGEGEEQGTEAE